MCGIAGYFTSNALITSQQTDAFLRQASTILAHRGPDGEGFWNNDHVGLMHRWLKIMDLNETGRQPLSDSRFHLTYNGEIYNYLALARTYDYPGIPPNDTVVLHHLLKNKGIQGLAELDGMFAGGMYDEAQDTLYVFRDIHGIKPLVYYWDGKTFLFASEIKALFAWGIERKICQEALLQYFAYEFIPSRQTIFQNVFKLLPGEVLTITRSGIQSRIFASSINSQPATGHQLEADLEQAVVSQMSAQVPLGAFFSGGIDSTAVAWKAAQHMQGLTSFTITFDNPDFDESTYAQRLLQHLPIENRFHRIPSDVHLEELIYKSLHNADEPFGGSSIIPVFELSRVTAQELRVALCGDGGDERFLGYGYYLLGMKTAPLRPFFPLIHTLLKYAPSLRYQRIARYFANRRGIPLPAHFWMQAQDLFLLSELKQLFRSPIKDMVDLIQQPWAQVDQKWQELTSLFPQANEAEIILRKLNLFDQLVYFPFNLMYKTDIASMANSLEVRVPFMSTHLSAWNVALNPLAGYYHEGELKHGLKKLLAQYFPHELIYRPKWGFPAPVGKWLQKEASFLIDRYLNEATLRQQDLFNTAYVNQLVQEFRQGKTYHYKRLWMLICFQIWHEKYMC